MHELHAKKCRHCKRTFVSLAHASDAWVAHSGDVPVLVSARVLSMVYAWYMLVVHFHHDVDVDDFPLLSHMHGMQVLLVTMLHMREIPHDMDVRIPSSRQWAVTIAEERVRRVARAMARQLVAKRRPRKAKTVTPTRTHKVPPRARVKNDTTAAAAASAELVSPVRAHRRAIELQAQASTRALLAHPHIPRANTDQPGKRKLDAEVDS